MSRYQRSALDPFKCFLCIPSFLVHKYYNCSYSVRSRSHSFNGMAYKYSHHSNKIQRGRYQRNALDPFKYFLCLPSFLVHKYYNCSFSVRNMFHSFNGMADKCSLNFNKTQKGRYQRSAFNHFRNLPCLPSFLWHKYYNCS